MILTATPTPIGSDLPGIVHKGVGDGVPSPWQFISTLVLAITAVSFAGETMRGKSVGVKIIKL